MKTKMLSIVPAVLLGLGLLACSSSDASTSDDAVNGDGVDIAGKAEMFPGFTFDSGMQPPASPVQAEVKASVVGELRVAARGAKKDGKLAGVAASGKLAIELHTKLEGTMKIAAGTIHYNGPIPGLDKIDVPIAADAPFDPFLLGDGEKVAVDAKVPPTDLPPIPLAAVGVPGTLNLKVKEGSTVHAALHGSCVQAAGGKATFSGTTETSGTVVLSATLKLDIPLVGDVKLPDFQIALPSAPGTISAEGDASGLADFQDGACAGGTSEPPPAKPASPDGGSPSSDGGTAATCGTAQQKGAIVQYEYFATPLPAGTGGVIKDGTWVLVALRGYGSAPSSGAARARETIVFRAGTFEDIVEQLDVADGAFHGSGTYSASNKTLTQTFDCPQAGTLGGPYSTDGASLTIYDTSTSMAFTYGKL
jgi:hypothetical protein